MAKHSIIRSEASTPSDIVTNIDAAMREIHDRVRRLVEDSWGRDELWTTPLLQGVSLLPSGDGLVVEPFGHLAEDLKALREGWRTPTVHYEVLDDEVVLQAEMPGIHKDDVHLEVAPGFIRIQGEREGEVKKKVKGAARMEKTARRFRTVVSPGAAMDPNRVSANYADGVLEVRVARSDAGAPRTRVIDLH